MRLSATLRFALYSSFAVLYSSGALWIARHYLPLVLGSLGQVPETSWLALHGAGATVALAAMGGVLAVHSAPAWREGQNRASGLGFGAGIALLVVTGYLLYYAGGEALRDAASVLHWALGLAAPLLLVFHIRQGRRGRAAACD
jgi:hypothetical protein